MTSSKTVKTPPSSAAPTGAVRPWRLLRLPALILGLAVFAAMAIPYHPHTGWNVNTRLNLIFALVEQGTLAIDAYHDTPPYDTNDKAYFDGHYYSDKIFGMSLPALPVYALAHALHGGPLPFHAAHYLLKTVSAALPGAIGALFFFLILARTGTPPRRAILLTALAVGGSMWLGYGTVFYPYVAGIAAALAALAIILFPPAGRLTGPNCLSIGLLCGLTLLCDLTFGLVIAGIGMIWLLRLLDQLGVIGLRAFAEMKGERIRLKGTLSYAGLFAAGVLIPLSLFAAYCLAIFGELTIPYRYEVDPFFREGMAQGFMGITTPKAASLYFITVHPYRGVLYWSPLLLAGVAGCIIATRQYGRRLLLGWLGLWCFVSYLLFNSAYYQWWGGWAMGPRLMIPMLPFVFLGCGELLRGTGRLSFFATRERWEPVARWATMVLGVGGVLLSLPLSLTDPQLPQGVPTETLLTARPGDGLPVPHHEVLRTFYSGGITILPSDRLQYRIANPDAPLRNGAALAVYLLLAGGLAALAWRLAPTALPGMERTDYPFATIDGAAAPPPSAERSGGVP